jgi:hypothetical protein
MKSDGMENPYVIGYQSDSCDALFGGWAVQQRIRFCHAGHQLLYPARDCQSVNLQGT